MKLALGTVQFGMNYGIVNKGGQVRPEEIARILHLIRDAGVDTIDTATSYGESEQRLGEAGVSGLNVVSKLPPLPADTKNVDAWALEIVENSLRLLRIENLHGLLLHKPSDLDDARGDDLFGALNNLKTKGLTSKIGFSIYAPGVLDSYMTGRQIDLLQAPFNVVDRRLETSGWMQRLKDQNVEIHTRSTFLQGLLLLKRNERPDKFHLWESIWNAWEVWLDENKLSALEGCLGYVQQHPQVDRVIAGVDDARQMQQLINAVQNATLGVLPECSSEDRNLIDPSRWDAF